MSLRDNLVDTWTGRVRHYLETLEENRISSQTLKKALAGADKVAPMTWTRIIQAVLEKKHHLPNKEIPLGNGVTFGWKLEGRSLVRETAERYPEKIDWGSVPEEVPV